MDELTSEEIYLVAEATAEDVIMVLQAMDRVEQHFNCGRMPMRKDFVRRIYQTMEN